MITRHHVFLGLLAGLIVGSAAAFHDPLIAALIVAGTLAGVVLPDNHMKRPRDRSVRLVAWGIAQAGRVTIVSALCTMYRVILAIPCASSDKRVSHSITGFFGYCLLPAGTATVLIAVLPGSLPARLATAFAAGMILGLLLHLVQDGCTRKGIVLFYPFSEIKLYGSIRPCDVLDPRIFRFHIVHGLALVIVLMLWKAPGWSLTSQIFVGALAICACIATMVVSSGIRTELPADNPKPDGIITADDHD